MLTSQNDIKYQIQALVNFHILISQIAIYQFIKKNRFILTVAFRSAYFSLISSNTTHWNKNKRSLKDFSFNQLLNILIT